MSNIYVAEIEVIEKQKKNFKQGECNLKDKN